MENFGSVACTAISTSKPLMLQNLLYFYSSAPIFVKNLLYQTH